MSKKLIGIALIISIAITLIVSVVLILQYQQNKFPLEVIESESTWTSYGWTDQVTLEVKLHNNHTSTLFNCVVEVKYLTQNDTWKNLSQNIGIMEIGEYKTASFVIDNDYKKLYIESESGHRYLTTPNATIQAYG